MSQGAMVRPYSGFESEWKHEGSDKGNTRNISSISVRFSHSVVFDSLQLHGLQHARLPCPSAILDILYRSALFLDGNYNKYSVFLSSGQFSHSVVSNSLWLHVLQYTMLPCPWPTLRACSNSCPSSQWCHPTISSSVIPFSSCPQSFPASGSFPMSQLFISGGQSIGVCFNISPSSEHSGLISFRMDWLDLLAVQGTLKNILQHHSSKASILWC